MSLSQLSSINLRNDSISWCRTQVHPITGQDQSWTTGIWRTGGKRSHKREEEGEQREENGRSSAVDDRTTSVYPPAKPLPEFIIICSTTSAVCGLRPRGAHPLWYQIILRRNKKAHSHTRARARQRTLRVLRNAHRRTWPRNPRDTTGHGRRRERKRRRRLREANFGPVFHHFHGGREAVSFPRPPATSVKARCFEPHDDNAAANVFVAFALTGKLGNFHEVVFKIGL